VIYENFPASPPAISQQLKVLREAIQVLVEKRAQQRIYRINPEVMHELEDWAKRMTRPWSERFEALDRILEAEKMKLKGDAK
jgi:DNA-binding transcriptional ArsR family regulator